MSNYSFCQQCGKPLSENTKFCPECGWKVPVEANVQNPTVQKQPEPVAAGNSTTYAPNNLNSNQFSSNTYAGNTYQTNQQFQQNPQFQGNPQYQGSQQFQNQFPNNQQYPGNPYPGNNYVPNNYAPKAKKSAAPIIITVAIIAILAVAAILYFVVLKSDSGIKAEDLNGNWTGSLTITDVEGTEEPSPANMNKPVSMTGELDISSSGKGSTTLTIESSDDKGTVTYSDGQLKMIVKEGGGSITFNGSVKKSGKVYTASGKFSGGEGELKVSGTWKMTKSSK